MKEKLLAFWNGVKSAFASTSSVVGAYLARIAAPALSILVIIGGALAVVKYKELIMKLISFSAQKEVSSAQKENTQLSQQENADKQTEQQLEQKANNEPNPGDDWFKKK